MDWFNVEPGSEFRPPLGGRPGREMLCERRFAYAKDGGPANIDP